jgi:hypothetical protein
MEAERDGFIASVAEETTLPRSVTAIVNAVLRDTPTLQYNMPTSVCNAFSAHSYHFTKKHSFTITDTSIIFKTIINILSLFSRRSNFHKVCNL